MIYVEYHEYKNKYYAAQKEYDKILSEKERLFSKTQPGSIDYSKEPTSGGERKNAFDTFVINMENKQIDEKLEVARSILEDRTKLLKLKEEELRLSDNPYDKIYYYKFVKCLSPYKMKRYVGYEASQIYRILEKIEKKLNMTQKDIKNILQ